jgi:glycosyltransferase involved in cell wall biosynthesis
VATTTACEGFAVKDGEHVLIADDASSFAAALSRCLVDAALCSRLGTRARELVLERYSVQAAARGFEDVYREVLEEHHRG